MFSPYLHNRRLGAKIGLAHADCQSNKTARSFQNYVPTKGLNPALSYCGHFLCLPSLAPKFFTGDSTGWYNMVASHSTKIQTGPTGKRGPPQKVDLFFRNFSGWTELIHWVLDRNFRKFWLNGSRPKCLTSPSLSRLQKLSRTTWPETHRPRIIMRLRD